jgi:hypothetical protein
MLRHETGECTLVKHQFWIEALDHAGGEAAFPKVGDSVSFRLYATQVRASSMPPSSGLGPYLCSSSPRT